ncbi:hypothetical protein AAVH_16542 [Aphelenchoides avenae]|nr:hypothetical protein AAVH_16542 [Aphelenchus avenae]
MEIGKPLTKVLEGKRCIENLPQLEGYLFCFAGGQDNTDCCNAAGVTTKACLDLCAGKAPVEGMNSRAFRRVYLSLPAQVMGSVPTADSDWSSRIG